ncbi:MAG: 1,4-alpha-glucan branching protein GlgB [Clostridia bacterium]|nr:1,4-alpha-glucan branching protein GlgB [Clostridia bacterium]
MKEKQKQKKLKASAFDHTSVTLFRQGENLNAYEYFGCHKMAGSGVHTYVFRVWAPSADAVALVSDFCGWDEGVPMRRIEDTGVWELQYGSPVSLDNCFYKYKVTCEEIGRYKADPYAVAAQTRSETASVLRDGLSFSWEDSAWLAYRSASIGERGKCDGGVPLNIYELHLGSWQKALGGGELNYRQLADRLAPYVKQMGYTHVELMPVMEHGDDNSFGYRTDAYYAPTSRYGTPEDLMYFVNKLHLCGVGVILDWVPSYFSDSEHGLASFDGHTLYERAEEDIWEPEPKNIRFFDLGKGEVQSFLISNAMYWLRRFHADGLCVVSVAELLAAGSCGGEDRAAVDFLRRLNRAVSEEFPSAITIADAGPTYPGVTKPLSEGGLGFSYAWNTAWTGAACTYVAGDPIYRQYMHDKLTTPLVIAHDAHGILAIPHTEVTGGKRALIDKMYGGYEEKFASMRAFLTYMMTFPGKKLSFMGCELAQFREWNPGGELEWFMVENYPRHRELHHFIKTLNSFYLSQPPLWEQDDSPNGFVWIEPNDKGRNVISYRRIAKDESALVIVVSFSPIPHRSYWVYVPEAGRYQALLQTEERPFGGGGALNNTVLRTKKHKDGKEIRHYLELDLPPYASLILKRLPSVKEGTAGEPAK